MVGLVAASVERLCRWFRSWPGFRARSWSIESRSAGLLGLGEGRRRCSRRARRARAPRGRWSGARPRRRGPPRDSSRGSGSRRAMTAWARAPVSGSRPLDQRRQAERRMDALVVRLAGEHDGPEQLAGDACSAAGPARSRRRPGAADLGHEQEQPQELRLLRQTPRRISPTGSDPPRHDRTRASMRPPPIATRPCAPVIGGPGREARRSAGRAPRRTSRSDALLDARDAMDRAGGRRRASPGSGRPGWSARSRRRSAPCRRAS